MQSAIAGDEIYGVAQDPFSIAFPACLPVQIGEIDRGAGKLRAQSKRCLVFRLRFAGTTAPQAGDTPYAQAKGALEIIGAALTEAGVTFGDVVRTRIFVTDITQWEEVGRAHGEVFADIRPVTTMVEVSALIDPTILVEIEATAYRGPQA